MEFIQNLLGSEGCNVDGTVGNNAITMFMDQAYQNSMLHGEIGESADQSGDVYFVSEPASVIQINNNNSMAGVSGYTHGFVPYHHTMPFQFMPPLMSPNQFVLSGPPMYSNNVEYENQVLSEQQHSGYSNFIEGISANNSTLENAQGSKEGYTDAWKSISDKLESNVLFKESQGYQFHQENDFQSHFDDANNNYDTLFEEAMQLFYQGHVNRAILAFEAIVQQRAKSNQEEDNTEVWRMLGVCHCENDEDKKAILCFNNAIESDPYNIEALLALGSSYVNELDSIKALETLKSWVIHNPKFHGLDINNSNSNQIDNNEDPYSDGTLMDEVTRLMLQVNAFAPNDRDVQIVLGVLYNVSLDYDNAIECFEHALQQTPDDYSLINKLAATLANSNQSSEAISLYAKAIELRPTYARGWLNLGISYANLNQYDEASKAYIQALHLNPGATHIWGYLRVILNCMDRLDLIELSSKENAEIMAKAMDFELL